MLLLVKTTMNSSTYVFLSHCWNSNSFLFFSLLFERSLVKTKWGITIKDLFLINIIQECKFQFFSARVMTTKVGEWRVNASKKKENQLKDKEREGLRHKWVKREGKRRILDGTALIMVPGSAYWESRKNWAYLLETGVFWELSSVPTEPS